MSKARISQLSITGAPRGKARISRLSITGTIDTARARISRLSIIGTQPLARARISQLAIYGGSLGSLLANAGPAQTVEPLTLVVLDGSATTGNPTSVLWAQVSNGAPTVVIANPAALITSFQAPATPNGVDVIIQLTVGLGAITNSDQSSTTVYPHLIWGFDGSGHPTVPLAITDI